MILITPRLLSFFQRYREADSFGRRQIARQVTESEFAGLERLNVNLAALPAGVSRELSAVLAGLMVLPDAISPLARILAPVGREWLKDTIETALRDHVAGKRVSIPGEKVEPAAAAPPKTRPAPTLTPDEALRLQSCEAQVARGLQTFREVGGALEEIRSARLYRATHSTFEAYLRDRWRIGRGHAYNVMAAAEVVAQLERAGATVLPTSEKAARPLLTVPQGQRRQVWERAVESAGDAQVTARQVRAAVQEQRAPGSEPPSVPVLHGVVGRRTVRFEPEVWERLEARARAKGTSVYHVLCDLVSERELIAA